MFILEPVVKIGDWYYQPAYGQLREFKASGEQGDSIRLEPQLQRLLNYFLLNPGKILTKDVLIEHVWPQDKGTDAAVMRAVGVLRKQLQDDSQRPRYIITIPKQGYCWLAEIEVVDLNDKADSDMQPSEHKHVVERRHLLRFLLQTTAIICVLVLGTAYLLTLLITENNRFFPETINPVSAMRGQEFWPLFQSEQAVVFYQHQPDEQSPLRWMRQRLDTLQIEQAQEQYQQISEALWQTPQQIIFRAVNQQQHCYWYQQQILPVFSAAEALSSCRHFMTQAAVLWQDKLLWLDYDSHKRQYQLWFNSHRFPELFYQFSESWRTIDALLIKQDTLYLLVGNTAHYSQIWSFDLYSKQWQKIADFPYAVRQFSWWDDKYLLLSMQNGELGIYHLASAKQTALGPLTQHLFQAKHTGQQILATERLNAATDMLRFHFHYEEQRISDISSWFSSNRSEQQLAVAGDYYAFVSDRTGSEQIWLAHQGNIRQLSHLKREQHIQQLFWHQDQLLAMIDNSLYQIDIQDGQLSFYHKTEGIAGRYLSCHKQLFWTENHSDRWHLKQYQQSAVVLDKVVDVRCAPFGLVVQFSDTAALALWQDDELFWLPVELDWRLIPAEFWAVNAAGIYWLDKSQYAIQFYDWHNQQIQVFYWPDPEFPLALYHDVAGESYVVRPRPYDSDIVLLQK